MLFFFPMISVIIPTYNEAEHIGKLVSYLLRHGGELLTEVIVADGGSQDQTLALAEAAGAQAFISPVKGRAGQMNAACQRAKGSVFYFVHADTLPTESFAEDIATALKEGYLMGGYWFKFDSPKPMLRLSEWFSRQKLFFSRGGDQSIFVERAFFERLGAYDERFVVMEEYDFLRKARRQAAFKVIPKATLVSARKYEQNSWLRVNFANFIAVMMFRWGYAPLRILNTYKKLIKHPKADAPIS